MSMNTTLAPTVCPLAKRTIVEQSTNIVDKRYRIKGSGTVALADRGLRRLARGFYPRRSTSSPAQDATWLTGFRVPAQPGR